MSTPQSSPGSESRRGERLLGGTPAPSERRLPSGTGPGDHLPNWARARCGKTCGCEEICWAAQERAEAEKDDEEQDPYGWQADREADRYERWLDSRW